ncbi:MAG: Flp family type IVb pilin [Thermoanaerobacteraceae bacterium]|nr:Flp family type IVb pilin [Thermoanaerobacteraceae bacterium]
MFAWLKNFYRDEQGQGMTEYGLIIAVVAVLLIGSLVALKDTIAGMFSNVQTELNTQTGSQ